MISYKSLLTQGIWPLSEAELSLVLLNLLLDHVQSVNELFHSQVHLYSQSVHHVYEE